MELLLLGSQERADNIQHDNKSALLNSEELKIQNVPETRHLRGLEEIAVTFVQCLRAFTDAHDRQSAGRGMLRSTVLLGILTIAVGGRQLPTRGDQKPKPRTTLSTPVRDLRSTAFHPE